MGYIRKTPVQIQPGVGLPGDMLDVMLEPLPGHSDEEVVSLLERRGAADVDVLAPGFISARIRRAGLETLETVASVHPKAVKQIHFAG